MSLRPVYITQTGHFLPNDPIDNDEMEAYLGFINEMPSKSRRIVLRNNGIVRRFYALDRHGRATHTNAEMTALAIRNLMNNAGKPINSVDLLTCGTSSPDQLMPSHAVMVHGWLPEMGAVEVVSPSGVCCSGMHALKYAAMSIRTGEAASAISTGSERLSRVLHAEAFEDEVQKLIELEENPYIGFEKEFLRWMLSDGASAFLLSSEMNESGLNLRIDWLEGVSFANEMETCMYMGSDKLENGKLQSYMDYSPEEIVQHSVMSIKQDVKLLSESIVPLGGIKLKQLMEKHNMSVYEIDYFLPHLSSSFFKPKIFEQLQKIGMEIPYEKWFTNLTSIGNVGAGSIYLMVDELFHSGKLEKGQKIFMLVPESSRFSYMYCMLTVC